MARAEHLKIQERFVSVQGEGLFVGTPSSFIRVSGCNLRCTWCDTPRSSWAPEGTEQSVDELLEWCASGPQHVVVTGGEPFLFSAIAPLTARLQAAGHRITIETAGTLWDAGACADLMSISPKLSHSTPWGRAVPSLAQRHDRARINLDMLRGLMFAYAWQLKFVVRAYNSEMLAVDIAEVEALLTDLSIDKHKRGSVLLMPEAVDAETLRAGYARLVDVCKSTGMRLGQRLHIELFGNRPLT